MKKVVIIFITLVLILVTVYCVLFLGKKEEKINKYDEIIKYKLFDTVGNYSIYENNEDNKIMYYIVDNNEKKEITSGESSNIYKIYNDNYQNDIEREKYYIYNGYLINKVDNIISLKQFDNYSCDNRTDNYFKFCNDNLTIVSLNNKFGFFDIKTGKLLSEVKYEKIEEKLKNYFNCDDKICIKKDNRIIEQLKEYDEINYYSEIGYIGIKNNELVILNDNFDKLDLNNDIYNKLINIKYIKKLDILTNEYFNYLGNDLSGEKDLIIFDDGCDKYDVNNNLIKGIPNIYIVNNNKVKKIDSKLIETNIGICEYNEDPYKYKNIEKKSLNNYEIKSDEIINKNNSDVYDIYMNYLDPEDDSKEIRDIYVIQYDNNDDPSRGYNGIYNKKEGYIIEPYYSDVSCSYHSDESYRICKNSYTTLIDLKNLLSLKTGGILVETDGMNEISNGNFIGIKGKKHILYTSEGKELLKSDYIGYNKNIGYITINNDEITCYDEKLNKKELPDLDEIDLENAYNDWSSNNLIVKVDVKNNDYFKYTGSLTGNAKVFIFTCRDDKDIYKVENNKLVKLDKAKIIGDDCF